jgi:hypothetical protein
MISSHCKSQIEKREINIDIEMIEYLVKKAKGIDLAFILGEQYFLDALCLIILIVRHDTAITIEFRRKSQSITTESLKVIDIVKYPCTF